METITLTQRVAYIKKALGRPYHMFSLVKTGNKDIIQFTIENRNGDRLSFTGPTFWSAVEDGLTYVKNEIESGAIVDPNDPEGVSRKQPTLFEQMNPEGEKTTDDPESDKISKENQESEEKKEDEDEESDDIF